MKDCIKKLEHELPAEHFERVKRIVGIWAFEKLTQYITNPELWKFTNGEGDPYHDIAVACLSQYEVTKRLNSFVKEHLKT